MKKHTLILLIAVALFFVSACDKGKDGPVPLHYNMAGENNKSDLLTYYPYENIIHYNGQIFSAVKDTMKDPSGNLEFQNVDDTVHHQIKTMIHIQAGKMRLTAWYAMRYDPISGTITKERYLRDFSNSSVFECVTYSSTLIDQDRQ